ncbi:MAG: hypothetical protein H7321_08640 [Bacteroidia bacterium]|nr:hypothetical protein [Bacteroidia bacterium]
MKKIKISAFLFCFILLIFMMEGNTQKPPQKAEYEFPPFMEEYVKTDFLKQCIKGEVLYDLSCGKCHNLKIKKKTVIPDFTTEQLQGYDMRLANTEHQNNLNGTQVTTEELGYIISFLTYKKKSGIPATGDNLPH